MKPYPLHLEISGSTALWTRPETMPNPVSYVAPTFSTVPDYVGPFRDGTAPCATGNHVIPAFLEMGFDQQKSISAN